MAKMRAIDAAVRILEKEGVTCAFGVPGAAMGGPGRGPRVSSQAFHVMRSGRPGRVLIALPLDVQLAEIEFDDETYVPLEVYKPAATRRQIEKALEMLNAAERPLIVAGGGGINADAAQLLGAVAGTANVAGVPTPMGWGAIPDDHALVAGEGGP